MRARNYGQYMGGVENRANSHFLGLECVLDKYQHENQILSQKIQFLLSEKKRSSQLGTLSSQRSQSSCTKYNNQATCQQLDTNFDRRTQKPNSNHQFHDSSPGGGFQNQSPYLAQVLSISKYRNRQSQRRFCNVADTELSKSTRPLHSMEKEAIQQKQTRKRPTIFRREVYLERQTVLVDDEDEDKLPTFIEASFGNLQSDRANVCRESRESKQLVRDQSRSVMKMGKSLPSSYRLERTEEERLKMGKTKLRTEGWDKEWGYRGRVQDVGWGGKKTNYPYIKQDYKLAEPKTQLGRIQRCIKQEKDNKQNMDVRKTYLYVMSKKAKKSLFAK